MKRIKEFLFDEIGKTAFISSVITMIITHGFCFMNIMYTHDSLDFYGEKNLTKIALGRWLYPVIAETRSFATPWMMGALSILYISLAAVLVVKIFDLKKISAICTSAILSTSVSLIALFCVFIFDADAYCLSVLLAILAVYIFIKTERPGNIILSVICIVISLSLYQAHIDITIGLFLTYLLVETFRCNESRDILNVIRTGLKQLLVLIIGGGIYLVIMKLMIVFYDYEKITYNSPFYLNNLALFKLIKVIPLIYSNFVKQFFDLLAYNGIFMIIVNTVVVLVICVCIALFIYNCIKTKKKAYVIAFTIFICLLIPLGLNAIMFTDLGFTSHQLMTYSFCLWYLIPLILIDHLQFNTIDGGLLKKIKKGICIISVIAVAIVGFNNTVYANGAYVFRKLVYDNSLLHAHRIWEDINNIEGYREGETKVVFVGNMEYSNLAYRDVIDSKYYYVLVSNYRTAFSLIGKMENFYKRILGRNVNISMDYEIDNEKYKDMPVYPIDGYCKMIDGVVVIRVS